MKLLFKTNLSGFEYSVKYDSRVRGGYIEYDTKEIIVGTPISELLDTIIHEILEAIFIERKKRFCLVANNAEDEGLTFLCTHREFTNICKDLSMALSPIMKPPKTDSNRKQKRKSVKNTKHKRKN